MNRFLVFLAVLILLGGFIFLVTNQSGGVPDGDSSAQFSYKTEREVLGNEPGKPYSSAVKISRLCTIGEAWETVGETLYVSGQVGVNPETGEKVSGDIKDETRQVLMNLKSAAEAAGFSLSDAVRCTVYLVDMDDYAAMNEVYLEFFPGEPPSRACVGVSELVRDFRVEISLVAEK